MKKRAKPRPAKLKKTLRVLPDILQNQDKASLLGDLGTFLTSSTWNIVKAVISEEVFSHEAKMRTLLRTGQYHTEGVYELGATEALEYVVNRMIPDFVESLRSGKPIGLVEDERPGEDEANPTPEG